MNLKLQFQGYEFDLDDISSYSDLTKSIIKIDPNFKAIEFSYIDDESDAITVCNDTDLLALKEMAQNTLLQVHGVELKKSSLFLQSKIEKQNIIEKQILLNRLEKYTAALTDISGQQNELQKTIKKRKDLSLKQKELTFQLRTLERSRLQPIAKDLIKNQFYKQVSQIEKSLSYDQDYRSFEKTIYSQFKTATEIFDSLWKQRTDTYRQQLEQKIILKANLELIKKQLKPLDQQIKRSKALIQKLTNYYRIKIMATKARFQIIK